MKTEITQLQEKVSAKIALLEQSSAFSTSPSADAAAAIDHELLRVLLGLLDIIGINEPIPYIGDKGIFISGRNSLRQDLIQAIKASKYNE